jgi:hypothetical protein
LAPAWIFFSKIFVGSVLRTQRAHLNFHSEQCAGNQGTHGERLSSAQPQDKPSRDYKTGREGVTNESNLACRVAASEEEVVRNYLFRVFEKLGISSRVELVLYCLQQRQPFPAALPN